MWTSEIWTLCELEHDHFQWLMAKLNGPLSTTKATNPELCKTGFRDLSRRGNPWKSTEVWMGNESPLPSMMTGGQFTFLSCEFLFSLSLLLLWFNANYTMIWYDLFRANGGVMWGGCFFFLTRWIWRLDASALSATHHLPRPWVASWGSHSGGVGSRKATTFTDDSWFMMIYLLEMVIVQRLYLEWFLCSLQ